MVEIKGTKEEVATIVDMLEELACSDHIECKREWCKSCPLIGCMEISPKVKLTIV